jgi:hypothetical protein
MKVIDLCEDSNFKVDLLKTIVAYIEELMSLNKFDEALNLVKYIEEESHKSIKIC